MSNELLYQIENLLRASDRAFCEDYIKRAVEMTLINESEARYVWQLVFHEDLNLFRLINKTPHPIDIADADGLIIRRIPPELPPARVSSKTIERGAIDGVRVVETVFGEIENLPEPADGVVYIVSQIVIAAAPDRTDLVRPDTGPTCIRDADGKIVAVRALTR